MKQHKIDVKKYILPVCFILLLIQSVLAINADNPLFRFNGRWNFADATAPKMYWPGSSVEFIFEGTSLSLRLNDVTGDNFYRVIIDGDTAGATIIDCNPGLTTYPIASGLGDSPHHALVFKRTDNIDVSTSPSQSATTAFLGIELDNGKGLLPLPEKPWLRMEFYGNSITSGHGVLRPDNDSGQDNALVNKDNYYSYAALTARYFNADYRCHSQSGIGLMVTWGSGSRIMPEIYNRVDPTDGTSLNAFEEWQAHVVVVNLGQNDAWIIDEGWDPAAFKYRFGGKAPSNAQREQAYLDFFLNLRAHYPDAIIIGAFGNIDMAGKTNWVNSLQGAVQTMNVSYGDPDVYNIIFPNKGTPGHPTVGEQWDMAIPLIQMLEQDLDIVNRFQPQPPGAGLGAGGRRLLQDGVSAQRKMRPPPGCFFRKCSHRAMGNR